MRYLILLLLVLPSNVIAQKNAVPLEGIPLGGITLGSTPPGEVSPSKDFHILPSSGIVLDKGWKWQAGDNPEWAKPDFDDSSWESINPEKEVFYLPQIQKSSIGWLRIHLNIDSTLINKALAFQIRQTAASEVFLNGKLLQRYGIISDNPDKVKAYNPIEEPLGVIFDQANQVLAIRFSIQKELPYFVFNDAFIFFRLRIRDIKDTDRFNQPGQLRNYTNFIYGGLFFLLGLIHLGFFIRFPKQKANLYFSLFAFTGTFANLLYSYNVYHNDISIKVYTAIVDYILLLSFFSLFLLLAIHSMFSKPKQFYFWFLISYLLIGFIIDLASPYELGFLFGFIIPHFLANMFSFQIVYKAYLEGKRAVSLLVFGTGSYIILYFFFILIVYGIIPTIPIGYGFVLGDLFYHLSMICISLSFSIYLSQEFAFTSKDLEKKLEEVNQLSTEKQQILLSQNETLEKQVKERTNELNKSLEELKSTQTQLIQKEKLASLGELTAGIAHEIQNPLNFVNNFSELSVDLAQELKEEIEKVEMPQKEKEYIGEIIDDLSQNQEKINLHGKRASGIVKGMLEHSRTSTGKKELTDINTLADEYLRLAYHGFRAKDKTDLTLQFNAELQTDFDKNLPKIEAQSQELGRVLLNLINNAFYAVHQRAKKGEADYQPKVTLSTEQKDNQIIIKVKDNGTGIPENIKAKIFQPFFTTKPTGEGTGLGLSLAYDIVTKGHEGSLEVESLEGEGTEFIVKLPII